MPLNMVDVSSHQPVEAVLTAGTQAVIVKATQGLGYVNPSCDAQYQLAKKNGMLLGVYHYAGGGDPVAEANYFYNNIKGYVHEAILVLDWEEAQNAQYTNPNWCRTFVNRIHELTGVWCIMYGNRQDMNYFVNCVDTCALWFAGYPDLRDSWTPPAFQYDISPWKNLFAWQFTTSNFKLDRSICYVDAAAWRKFANPGSNATTTTTTTKKPAGWSPAGHSLEEMANAVGAGQVGDGDKRKQVLGKYYTGVQAIVNHRAGGDAGQTVKILADETMKNVYGTGDGRKKLLGSYFQPVQDYINSQSQPQVKTYTVQSGDTLSGIAAKLNVNWVDLAAINGIAGPAYIIYPGQVLKY